MTRGAETWPARTAASGPAESLRPFTATAEVPAVGHDPFADTGQAPAYRRPVPLLLRLAIGLVLLVLLVGVAGLVIHKVRPAWLRPLEPTTSGHAASTTPTAAAGSPATTGSNASSGVVHEATSGPTSATVTLTGSPYTVVVSAQAPCWVQVTTPASATPEFASLLLANTQQTFHPADGQLALILGASKVTVTVVVGGTPTSWQFTPTAVPFVLSFTSQRG